MHAKTAASHVTSIGFLFTSICNVLYTACTAVGKIIGTPNNIMRSNAVGTEKNRIFVIQRDVYASML